MPLMGADNTGESMGPTYPSMRPTAHGEDILRAICNIAAFVIFGRRFVFFNNWRQLGIEMVRGKFQLWGEIAKNMGDAQTPSHRP